MKNKTEPRITYSPLTNRWYVLTRYRKVNGMSVDGKAVTYLRASVKYDVTDQMVTILREVERKTLARKRRTTA